MLKQVAVLLPIFLTPVVGQADTFSHARCSDLGADAIRAAHVVGWLNLQNRDGDADRMDFEKAERDTQKLLATCAAYPEMSLVWAVTAFAEIDSEEDARPFPKDNLPVGSIPGKRASAE